MARFISVCTSLNPQNVVTIPCDQFDVNDDGSISAYYNGELWGHFAEYEYAHIVDEEVLVELGLSDEDDDEADDDDEPEQYSLNGHHPIVVPDDVSELEDDEDEPESVAPVVAAEDDDASR